MTDIRNFRRAWPAAAGLLLAAATPAWAGGSTERVSVGPHGRQANGGSDWASISADGRFVAFVSSATNLVPGTAGGSPHVFVRDRQSGTTEMVDIGPGGVQGNASPSSVFAPAISADGRSVTFISDATNLVEGDTNGKIDVFVRDRQAGRTERVSVGSRGIQSNGDSYSFYLGVVNLGISADGRFVAFNSVATNLVAGDTNGQACLNPPCFDVFVRDRMLRTTERVSVGSGGRQANGDSVGAAISADGRFVAFESSATNLVKGDTNGWDDVFVRDRLNGTTERVSLGTDGRQIDGGSGGPLAISPNGRFVAFDSNGLGILLRDRRRGRTELVATPDPYLVGLAISEDGRLVAYSSYDDNEGEPLTSPVFLQDRQTGTTEVVSVGRGGRPEPGGSPSMSADGRFVAFDSFARNLVRDDTNGEPDVFVRNR